MEDSIHERGKAIENLFFAEADQKLLNKLREEMASDESRQALAAAAGVEDVAVLDTFLANNITPVSLASVGLIPLVAVAWADGVMEDSEKNAILQAADIAGIKMGTPSYQTLEQWLQTKPQPELLISWQAYIGAMKTKLEPVTMTQLKNGILDRAESIAKAAGGFLGLGNKVSDSERKVLDELNRAFD